MGTRQTIADGQQALARIEVANRLARRDERTRRLARLREEGRLEAQYSRDYDREWVQGYLYGAATILLIVLNLVMLWWVIRH